MRKAAIKGIEKSTWTLQNNVLTNKETAECGQIWESKRDALTVRIAHLAHDGAHVQLDGAHVSLLGGLLLVGPSRGRRYGRYI